MRHYRWDPLSPREKAHIKRSKGLKASWSSDKPAPEIKKVREYSDTIGLKLNRRTKQGFNGCKLSPAIRAEIERRRSGRKEFFASLGVVV